MNRPLLRREWQIFLLALGFLTRLPVPPDPDFSAAKLNAASRYFPAVGLVVGGLGWLTYAAAVALFDQAMVAVLLSLALTALLTGAFHEDGFADSCDGLGGGQQREDVLRIMRDSRLGSFGAVGLLLLIMLKVHALNAIATTAGTTVVGAAIMWGHVVSRWLAVSFLVDQPYIGGDGKSKPMASAMSVKHLGLAGVAVLPLFLLGLPGGWWLLLPLLLGWRLLWAGYLRRRMGGYSGDTLGAAQQVAEVLIYLGFLL